MLHFTVIMHHAGSFTEALLDQISLSLEKGLGSSMILLTFLLSTFDPLLWYQQNRREKETEYVVSARFFLNLTGVLSSCYLYLCSFSLQTFERESMLIQVIAAYRKLQITSPSTDILAAFIYGGENFVSPAEIVQGNSVGVSSRNSSLLCVDESHIWENKVCETIAFPPQEVLTLKIFVGGLLEKLVVR